MSSLRPRADKGKKKIDESQPRRKRNDTWNIDQDAFESKHVSKKSLAKRFYLKFMTRKVVTSFYVELDFLCSLYDQ